MEHRLARTFTMWNSLSVVVVSLPVLLVRWPFFPTAKVSNRCACLPAKSARFTPRCHAMVGQVGNVEHMNVVSGKAGRTRWQGTRPTVRGMCMNPIDHPNGGGEGRSNRWWSSASS